MGSAKNLSYSGKISVDEEKRRLKAGIQVLAQELKTKGEISMPDELTELLDTAIYKEIASQALYIAVQEKTRFSDGQ